MKHAGKRRRWPRQPLTAVSVRQTGRWVKLGFALTRPLALWRARQHLFRVQRQLHKYDVQKVLNLPVEHPVAIDPHHAELLYRLAAKTRRRCHCLPQSIALYQNLISRGIPARHVIGINRKHHHGQPLTAHAWVEINHSLQEYKP